MSSLQLISHHLFVAAVKDGPVEQSLQAAGSGRPPAPRTPGSARKMKFGAAYVHAAAPEERAGAQFPVREFPLELIDFDRPLPVESLTSAGTFDWIGSA